MKTYHKNLKPYKRLLMAACLLLLCSRGYAQLTLNTVSTSGTYTDKTQIHLTNGFTAHGSAPFRAYIFAQPCQDLSTAPTNSKNYRVTYIPRQAGMTDTSYPYVASPSWGNCSVMATIQYYDGLGRDMQIVQVKGSPMGNDIVQPIAYDEYGRSPLKYLPYRANTDNGSYKSDALTTALANYYNTGDAVRTPYPFAETVFEASPLNRPLKQGAPGASWQISAGHAVQMAYGEFTVDPIALWKINTAGDGAVTTANYTNGTLYKSEVADENGHTSIEYKDIEGHVVCKKAQLGSSGTYVTTRYIYNDRGNLAYVIPPIPATENYPTSFVESDAIFTKYIYGYHHDDRDRLVEKKIPGKDYWESIVYNKLDQVIATQDGNQKDAGEWGFIKYDAFQRVVKTGIWNNGGTLISRSGLQGVIDGLSSPLFESRPTSGSISNVAWPTTSVVSTLQENYYDDYTFSDFSLLLPAYDYRASASTRIQGLPTCTKTWVLGSVAVLYKVFYYDDLGRSTRTYAQHYLAGTTAAASPYNYDIITPTYNFTNAVTKTVREHFTLANTATAAVTIIDSVTYDHMERKKVTSQKLNSASYVWLSQMDYNEIGQLKTKHLHSTNTGTSFLQDVNYTYNERGWLKNSSAPLFAMQLNYDDGTYPQYNGNIANQYWGTLSNLSKNYTYQYDELNRLKEGNSNTGFTETAITYDNLGNLLTLNRAGGANAVTLDYSTGYTGNRLMSVKNGASTFRSYTYDKNGNVLSDGQGTTIAYNRLNLPATITGKSLTYIYDAGGQKLHKISGSTNTDYIAGIQYTNGTIDFIQTNEGRVLNITGTPNYEYTLKDHLSNNRVTFDSNTGGTTARQVDDYYPFGLIASEPTVSSPQNNYLYNDKELQRELVQYDFGSRFYDPTVARFGSIDPKAEEARRYSVYAYAIDNPIRFIDIDGEGPGDRVKAARQMISSPYRQETEIPLRTQKTQSALSFKDCSEFVMRVLAADGVTNGVISRPTSTMKDFFKEKGFIRSMTPQVGDVALWEGHTGIVSGVDKNGRIKLIAGRGNKKLAAENPYFAEASKYASGDLDGYYRPAPGNETPDGKKINVNGDNNQDNSSNKDGQAFEMVKNAFDKTEFVQKQKDQLEALKKYLEEWSKKTDGVIITGDKNK